MRKQAVASVLMGAAMAFHLSPAMGETVAEFYKDKQLRLILGNSPAATTTKAAGSWRNT